MLSAFQNRSSSKQIDFAAWHPTGGWAPRRHRRIRRRTCLLGSSHEGCNRQATHPFCDLPLLRLRKCRIQYVPLKCDPAFEAMLLTISTTHEPATDLGFLLHKNPARSQSLDLAFGQAHMLYPEAGETCCTFALLLDLDPVAL
jgi:RNA repair, ligase-Pnkp-associating, region of Hen1